MTRVQADGDAVPWIDLSAMLSDGPSGVTVADIIEMPKLVTEDIKLEKNDVIKALQGEPVTDCAAFLAAYEEIEIGQSVTLNVERSGDEVDLTFTKPELPVKNVMMRKK